MIYLDHNATTAIKSKIIDLVNSRLLQNKPSNPSSLHQHGQDAKAIIEKSRKAILHSILGESASKFSLVFTSGCTEANNQIINTYANKNIIIGNNEHSSVIAAAQEATGGNAEAINVPSNQPISLEVIKRYMDKQKPGGLVSIAMADSEIGTIQDVQMIADVVHEAKCFLHIDATAALGKIATQAAISACDYATYSGHKIGSIAGSSALIYRSSAPLNALIHGGGQERKLRGGTENTLAIEALALATELAIAEQEQYFHKVSQLRKYAIQKIEDSNGEVIGKDINTLPNTIVAAINTVDFGSQLIQLDMQGIMVSSGSACNAGSSRPSEIVQKAVNLKYHPQNFLRISLNSTTTQDEIDKLMLSWKSID